MNIVLSKNYKGKEEIYELRNCLHSSSKNFIKKTIIKIAEFDPLSLTGFNKHHTNCDIVGIHYGRRYVDIYNTNYSEIDIFRSSRHFPAPHPSTYCSASVLGVPGFRWSSKLDVWETSLAASQLSSPCKCAPPPCPSMVPIAAGRYRRRCEEKCGKVG